MLTGSLALALIAVLVGTGAAMVYLGPLTINGYVDDHCRELVERLHYKALHRLAPGIGCTKYDGGHPPHPPHASLHTAPVFTPPLHRYYGGAVDVVGATLVGR